MNKEISKYILVGVTSNIISFLLYFILTKLIANVGVAASIGAFVGVCFTYIASGKWIFPSEDNINKITAIKYFTMYAFLIYLMGFITVTLTNILNLNYLLSWILAAGSVASLNFLGMKFFVFRVKK